MKADIEGATMEVTCEIAAVKPDYRILAGALLDAARAFFDNPENEAEFREWQKERAKRKAL